MNLVGSIRFNPAEAGAKKAYGDRKPLTEILKKLEKENKMSSIQDSYLKALNPTVSVKVTELNGKKIPEQIIKDIYATLTYKYRTFLDKENGVIYVGKKV